MKKVFSLVLISGLCITASAQSKFSIGPNAGLGWTTVSNIDNSTFNLGANAGIAMVYSAAEHFGLGLDVKYSFEGAKWDAPGGMKGDLDLHYVRIPVKAIYFFGQHGDKLRPKLFAGPSFGILSSAKQTVGSTEVDIKSTTESFDFGVLGGLGLNYRLVKNTWFNTDLSYTHGIKEINTAGDYSNRSLMLNVGVNFGL